MANVIEIVKYRPSNGTEGHGFMSRFCEQCTRDDGGIGVTVCEIIGDTMAYEVDEPDYPSAWTYDKDGRPCCTEFVAAPKLGEQEGGKSHE